jgi:hypothetical protein
LRLDIEPRGAVREPEASVGTLDDELFHPLGPCIERTARTWRFPPGRRTRVVVPVIFRLVGD